MVYFTKKDSTSLNAKDKLEGFIDRNQASAIKVLT
jgi:hypothetical protein